MVKKIFVVLGLGFGDDGKGLVTDYLCLKNENPIVIRFNGGQQAGHTVVTKDYKKHVFSNLGSGSFRNIPTYWSKLCTFSPVFFLEEIKQLKTFPILYLDNHAAVTTHYDVLFNQAMELTRGKNKHGSCGMGVGATYQREEYHTISFKVKDLLQSNRVSAKLKSIRKYYQTKINTETVYRFESFDHDREDMLFENVLLELRNMIKDGNIKIVDDTSFLKSVQWKTLIFEGAQGIMLDQSYGKKPFITKSNTTSQNAYKIIDTVGLHNYGIEHYYVTRSYSTRHGAGPFNDKRYPLVVDNLRDETNVANKFQGNFRVSCLNLEVLKYALKCDKHFSRASKSHLVMTCVDQLKSPSIPIVIKSQVHYQSPLLIAKQLGFTKENFKISKSPCADYL